MKTPPESFLLFKEELRKAQLEKDRLKSEYDKNISEVNKELARLKEQIQAQHEMLRTTIDYASNLEEKLSQIKKDVIDSNSQKNKSVF
ncbi:MAG: membrane-anchored protein YejM (alkaline phosphatase superfamily) [Algoriphagus sp.]|jgi:membrane-anchored protein YejM (alkaline phosphatase superfamily)